MSRIARKVEPGFPSVHLSALSAQTGITALFAISNTRSKEKGQIMETIRDRNSNQFAPPSLIEFLLGDGTRPGWLDYQPISMYSMLASHSQPISK
jgi:hypothetical protein